MTTKAMTIERGREWGTAQPLPLSSLIAHSDKELAQATIHAAPDEPIGLLGGDLARTLGATGDQQRLYGSSARTVSCDAMMLAVDDGEPVLAVANVAIGSLFRRSFAVLCNAAWLGEWNINPRSHPNDGRLESIDMSNLSLVDRSKARRRLPTGTHVPHPDVARRSGRTVEFAVTRPAPYRVDSGPVEHGCRFVVTVLADRFTIVV